MNIKMNSLHTINNNIKKMTNKMDKENKNSKLNKFKKNMNEKFV